MKTHQSELAIVKTYTNLELTTYLEQVLLYDETNGYVDNYAHLTQELDTSKEECRLKLDFTSGYRLNPDSIRDWITRYDEKYPKLKMEVKTSVRYLNNEQGGGMHTNTVIVNVPNEIPKDDVLLSLREEWFKGFTLTNEHDGKILINLTH